MTDGVTKKSDRLISAVAWIVALGVVALAAYLGWRSRTATAAPPLVESQEMETPAADDQPAATLPAFTPVENLSSVSRRTLLHTIIPNRPRLEAREYKVSVGDSIFEIAYKFNIKPETLLWANYDLLNDNPDMISLGMVLKVPPTDGVYYEWQEGDTIETVAARFEAKVEEVLAWAGNRLDLVDPKVEHGRWVMLPGGHREYRQWVIPTIPRGRAGVSVSLYGAGACDGSFDGAYGTGGFVWPAGNHVVSGNDYWDGHLGIDIGAGEGAPVYAADSGVVVFAGWANGGYGNMVMIDHGNGYQTLYGHMSSVNVGCGSSVGQGGTVGYAGNTGNSTGAHLHFEVRFQGGFVSPWYVLP